LSIKNHYKISKQQTTDKNINTDYFRWLLLPSLEDKLGDFYCRESSLKLCHRRFCDWYRTLFYI